MPRHSRVCFPNHPHHIVQRGHNREPVFLETEDYAWYLDTLLGFRDEFGMSLLAYCLMPNHVHIIVDPCQEPACLSLLMKRLAGRHTRRLNGLMQRTGTAWEGRFKCSPVDTDEYLLACTRYVELNPVRAGLVRRAEMYRWSSVRVRLGLDHAPVLDRNPAIDSLGINELVRIRQYRALLGSPVEAEDLETIRTAVSRNQLTGTDRFVRRVEDRFGRRVATRGRGRPVVRSEK
jgi:putative transposase